MSGPRPGRMTGKPYMNRHLQRSLKSMSSLQPDPKSKYTLIFKTTNTEPGFNIGIIRHNAEISGVA